MVLTTFNNCRGCFSISTHNELWRILGVPKPINGSEQEMKDWIQSLEPIGNGNFFLQIFKFSFYNLEHVIYIDFVFSILMTYRYVVEGRGGWSVWSGGIMWCNWVHEVREELHEFNPSAITPRTTSMICIWVCFFCICILYFLITRMKLDVINIY